ncbi:hypothetical protein HMPREF1544_02582 [Mucor circinelloides 1006PhL]|uniref:Uncharacterized protein n=1 Tax=Mucor circinelloides f. circinelloides (strain 1006PhL) TaxID=1220926 RepID=S2K573_MUCC1|nr:hypothetical protein HMPREF1544_02582 [Mucor circinelloides 1006PhL]
MVKTTTLADAQRGQPSTSLASTAQPSHPNQISPPKPKDPPSATTNNATTNPAQTKQQRRKTSASSRKLTPPAAIAALQHFDPFEDRNLLDPAFSSLDSVSRSQKIHDLHNKCVLRAISFVRLSLFCVTVAKSMLLQSFIAPAQFDSILADTLAARAEQFPVSPPSTASSSELKHGGGHIMIWGCMTYWGPECACQEVYDGIMKSEDYQQIVAIVLKCLEYYGLTWDDVYFQQENDPKHTSSNTT